ncbi:MAG TPA: DedA family protein [Thermomicrobiales bacterium]|nr:DedA family protein [Thermomicrobiales bacterium]
MHGLEQSIVTFLQQLFQSVGWLGVVLAMAIESACIPLPSEVTMPLAGWFLIQARGLGWEWTLLAGLYGAIGCTIGSAVAYWVGAVGGRPVILKYGKYILISPHHVDMADRWFAERGEIMAFVSRLLPVVRTFISFPAGIARMHFGRFLLYSFLGSLPWCWALAFGGYLLGARWEELREAMRPFDIPIVVVVLALLALFIWRGLKNRKNGEFPGHPDVAGATE